MVSFTSHKLRFAYLLPCFFIVSSIVAVSSPYFSYHKEAASPQKNRKLLEQISDMGEEELECIPSGIHSFPDDFLTQEQRQMGGVLLHVIITLYVCATIAIVCDKYFIPSLEIISDKLKLPPDVAGATFMAIGASSPELFSSILGSFVTEGDIGVGAVIGSAVFNILGITGVAGVYLWNDVLDIDWYPMARDCVAYGITVICLTWIISDSIVTWWESAILLGLFVLYIILMYFNSRVEKCSRNLKASCSGGCSNNNERAPLLEKNQSIYDSKTETEYKICRSTSIEMPNGKAKEYANSSLASEKEESVDEDNEESICSPPSGCFNFFRWFVMLPASVLLHLTIPNSTDQRCRILFPITFLMSIVWLGMLSYLAVWMVTIIGYTLGIPDSVSGLTILAVGASVPDLVTSVLVAKSGEGNMAISNLVGSNTFDISICLGVPWLAKSLLSSQGYLRIQSAALAYATAILIATLIIFYLIFLLSKWKLNRTVGFICLLVYALFVLFACLFEFNVFGEINAPTCYP